MQDVLRKLVTTAVLVAAPFVAHAAQPSPAFQHRPELEVATGPAARNAIATTGHSPKKAAAAWLAFHRDVGGEWSALWDDHTSVPLRIFGSGIPAPGSVGDPAIAERRSRDLIKRHLALLAPGNAASDFVAVSNELHHGIRTVGFRQHHAGIRVIGGQLSFRFKADRLVVIGSEALPSVKVSLAVVASKTQLKKIAAAWILQDSATTATAHAVEGPYVLPIVRSNAVDYHTVMAVTVDGQSPLGRWRVFLDAKNGTPIAREQTLRFAEGTVLYNVPLRGPLGERSALPARNAALTVDDAEQISSTEGVVSWPGIGDANVSVSVDGPLVSVATQTGSAAGAILVLGDDDTISWDEAGDAEADAQLSAFIHARIAKEAARTLNPSLTWLDDQLPVRVNINDDCNAYSDGNSINFFLASSQCENTARLADVVYHEFGHSLHMHSIVEGVGSFDGAFSEGLSDYLAASITDDPAMGLGFFKTDEPLRHIDPSSREHIWPEDIGEIHYTGLIFAGAMWDLRKLLIDRYGAEVGASLANRYFYGAVQRSSNIPATYVEILLEDDDDGDLANGTPNLCDINSAFAAHGLRAYTTNARQLSVVSPAAEGYRVDLQVLDLRPECPGDSIASASLDWVLRDDSTAVGEAPMEESGDVFTGVLPSAADGQVIRYKIKVEFNDGSSTTFPTNPADVRYEVYVGDTVELFCTDFESDPFEAGWTHGLSSGGSESDWTWGAPRGDRSNGDPAQAFSGDNVLGMDLGGDDANGRYRPNQVSYLLSPEIDIGDYSDVRLHYRRWVTVEDAYYDQASISSNDTRVWTNLNSDQGESSSLHHVDSEWRFHDLSLRGTTAGGKVQIKYELKSDAGLEFGGWTIDDFCIVANANAICGDGEVFGSEECDEGDANSDTEADSCRTSCLAPMCGDGILDTGETCDDGNTEDGDGCSSNCLPPGTDGDCGCTVGASMPWTGRHSLLALLAVVGLIAIRRRRAQR